jgi:hypothetical protein
MRDSASNSLNDVSELTHLALKVKEQAATMTTISTNVQSMIVTLKENCSDIETYSESFKYLTDDLSRFYSESDSMYWSLSDLKKPLADLRSGFSTFQSIPFGIFVITVFAGSAGLCFGDLDALRVFRVRPLSFFISRSFRLLDFN